MTPCDSRQGQPDVFLFDVTKVQDYSIIDEKKRQRNATHGNDRYIHHYQLVVRVSREPNARLAPLSTPKSSKLSQLEIVKSLLEMLTSRIVQLDRVTRIKKQIRQQCAEFYVEFWRIWVYFEPLAQITYCLIFVAVCQHYVGHFTKISIITILIY